MLASQVQVTKVPLAQGLVFETAPSFDVYLWSDQHFGGNECNYELAENIVEHIKDNKKARVVLGGDLLEAIPRGYKISERGQRCTPDFQISETIDRLKPIAKKIDLIFKGNHNTEARGESVDSDYLVAHGLGVKYKTVPTVIQYRSKVSTLRFAGGHGKSGAKNGDLELETLKKIFPGCQVYFLGHNHMLYAKQSGSLVFDENGNEHWEESWLVRTGNCLNYAEYARYGIYVPQRSGCIKFEIVSGKIARAIEITDSYFKESNG